MIQTWNKLCFTELYGGGSYLSRGWRENIRGYVSVVYLMRISSCQDDRWDMALYVCFCYTLAFSTLFEDFGYVCRYDSCMLVPSPTRLIQIIWVQLQRIIRMHVEQSITTS